jgi:hypothetical protein
MPTPFQPHLSQATSYHLSMVGYGGDGGKLITQDGGLLFPHGNEHYSKEPPPLHL